MVWKENPLKARDLTLISLGSALIAVCAWISVPAAVPFTMQTFAVCLIAALLGLRRGLWSVGIYLLLGAFGLPVFAGFKSGLGTLLGTTGGYLIGFLFTSLIVGLASDRWGCRLPSLLGFMALGLLVCYLFGTLWFMWVYARTSGPIGIASALSWCVLPYLPADTAKLLLAALLTRRLAPLVKRGDQP